MPSTQKLKRVASCSCGQVQLEAVGAPILTASCHCDDCQKGSQQIEALPKAPPVRDPDGGSPYMVFRKDRVSCVSGTSLLKRYRLREGSPTSRIVAGCCNSAMYLDFEKGHWLNVYRPRFGDNALPLQMHVQRKVTVGKTDVPSYPGYPLKLMTKLIGAKIAMLLHL